MTVFLLNRREILCNQKTSFIFLSNLIIAQALKKWMSLSKSFANTESHISFLIECRRADLLPKHLMDIGLGLKHFKFSERRTRNKYQRNLSQFQQQLLNLEIKEHHHKLRNIKQSLSNLKKFISDNLPNYIIKKFFQTQELRSNKLKQQNNVTKKKKFDKLYDKKYGAKVNTENGAKVNVEKGWFKNLTNVDIPQEVIDTVSLGDKFSVNRQKIYKNDKIELIKCVESNLNNLDEKHHNEIRLNLVNSIQNSSFKQQKIRHINHFENKINQNLKITNNFVDNNNSFY